MSNITLTSTGSQADVDAALALGKPKTPPPTPAAPPAQAATPPADATQPTTPPPTPPTSPSPASEAKPGEPSKPAEESKPAPKAEEPPVKPSTIEAMQERINKLTHAKYSTEGQLERATTEIQRLNGEIAALKAAGVKPAEKPTEAPFTPAPKPSEDDIGTKYKDYSAFTEAVAEWAADNAVAKLRHEQQQRDKQAREESARQQATQSEQEALQVFQQRAVEFAKETPDYNEKVGTLDTNAIHPFVLAHIVDSEMGPQLAYHLAQHPEELTKIHSLKKAGQVVAYLGRLEGKLEKAAPTTPAAETPKEERKTPPPPPEPIEPVRVGAVTQDIVPVADGSNFRAWKERRDQEVRGSRR